MKLLPIAILISSTLAFAQNSPQLSPQAAYEQAARPLELTRDSVANWSETELAALSVAQTKAAEACSARAHATYSGDDLISLARLCSFGQNWQVMGDAALLYINADEPSKPQIGLAYAFRLKAALQSRDITSILIAAESMLVGAPYDLVADSTYNEAIHSLQLSYTADALRLFATRQKFLISALKSPKPPIPRHLLYADGIAAATLQQYTGQSELAAATIATFDEALGNASALSPDDAIPVSESRRQYALLGSSLPKIQYELSLNDLKPTQPSTEMGSATAFLLFPEWCAQCIRLGLAIPAATDHFGKQDIHVYALLAGPTPEHILPTPRAKPSAHPVEEKLAPKTAAQLLLHTPTYLVAPETLTTFAAADFPLLIVADHAGIVRFIGPAPESALQPGDFLDQVASHIGEQWPLPKAAIGQPQIAIQ